jgi:hypothetical protein
LADNEITGGCQCGAVRYAIAPGPLPCYVCHCRECQKQTASAFAISVPVATSRLTVRGDAATYTRATDSGSTTACHFCPTCGTRLFHQSARSPELVTLKAGTLDDASALMPLAHLWVSRKHAWVHIPDDIPAFETQPDDLKAWRTALLR